MKSAVKLLVLFCCLRFGVAKISAEADSEIENDLMQMAPSPTDNPSHLAKHDLMGENSSNSEIPFLERFWSSLFPSYKHQTTTPMPSFILAIRFFMVNNSDEFPAAATEGGNGDQDLVQKPGPTSSSAVPTEKNSKSSRRKRNGEHKVGHLAKRLSLHFDDNDDYNTEGKKKPKYKKDEKSMSINDMSRNFNKSSNGTTIKICYRRLYTYVRSVDWTALFIHIFVLLVFIFVLIFAIVSCHELTTDLTGLNKRVKTTPAKYGRSETLQICSV